MIGLAEQKKRPSFAGNFFNFMETFFAFIDGVVLALAVLGALWLAFRSGKNATVSVRPVALYFAFFGASLLASSMLGHLFENSYRAALSASGAILYLISIFILKFKWGLPSLA